jgi:hypothetical protein
MVVKTQHRHPGHRGAMGLHVGAENVQRYFPPDVLTIELELDHLQIACSLDPSFWQDSPEIHDTRLSCWLEAKRNSGKLGAFDAPLAMIPCGRHTFKVQVGTEALPTDNPDYAPAGPPTAAYFAPVVAPATLLDRRRRNLASALGHKPDRRRVARLKSDDRTAPAANH